MSVILFISFVCGIGRASPLLTGEITMSVLTLVECVCVCHVCVYKFVFNAALTHFENDRILEKEIICGQQSFL